MNKQNVAIGVLVTGAFLMSGYTVVNNAMEQTSRQAFMYDLKQGQLVASNKINSLFDNYNAIDESLTYYDAGIVMNMEKIDENLSALGRLSTIDKQTAAQLKTLRRSQQGQADELLEIRDEHSATGGLGIITGQRDAPIVVVVEETQPLVAVIIEPKVVEVVEPVEVIAPLPIATLLEPVVLATCPKVDGSVDFGKHLRNITFRRAIKFTVTFDIQDAAVANITYSKDISRKLDRAVTKYLHSAIPAADDVLNCSIPFTIGV